MPTAALRRWSIALPLCAATLAGSAAAEDLVQNGKTRWVALASSKDLDTAIGIARLYSGSKARVAASKSGWFGVVFGPVEAATIAEAISAYQGWPELPKDALLSRGEKYTATAWQPPEEAAPAEFGEAAPARLAAPGLDVTVGVSRDGDNTAVTFAISPAGGPQVSLKSPGDFYVDYGTTAYLAKLDAANPALQVVATQNTGGAHCCVQTWIVTPGGAGGWAVVDAGALDGEGFWTEDVDGDGTAELLSVDNSFLYAFSSYAESFAPLRISRLAGKTLSDVTAESGWQKRIVQDLARMEFLARLDPSLWHSNGYLAAWVATKIELGEGREAWKRMLKSYDRNSDFGPQTCTTGQSVEDCPVEKLKQVPFPEGLAAHLEANGYRPVPR